MTGHRAETMCAGWAAAMAVAFSTAAPAVEQTLAIRDYTGRGFAPDVVHYSFKGNAGQAENLRLFDSGGKPLPLQVTRPEPNDLCGLSFVAEVPPDGAASYTLRDSGERAATGLAVRKTGEHIEITTSILGVRLPPETDKRFDPPVEAQSLPAPVLAFRSGPPAWLGAGAVLTRRKVAQCRIRLEAEGPVSADVLYELVWAGGGFYRARVSVSDRLPLVKVREEYDLGALDGTDFWELSLTKGWSPDRMEVARTHGNGSGIDPGRIVPLEQLATMKQPRITPDTCPPSLSQLGLLREAEWQANPVTATLAGVVPLRKGDWRKMNAVLVATTSKADVRVQFPMTARHAEWMEDSASETSPFSIIEHEPGLSRTYGRRLWGLVLAAPAVPDAARSTVRYSYFGSPQPISGLGPFAQARSLYGVVGLDRYKDYVLAWPDGGLKYPRLYNEPGVPAVQPAPPGPTRDLVGLCNAPITCPVISHHLTVGTYVTAAAADATMALANLTPEVRQEMRARLALVMYLFEEPDFIGYGNGAHSGNPNMGTSRYMGANAFLPLVADHPMFEKWRAHVAAYTEYKMASQIAPAGSYIEYGSSYHMHGYARTTCSLPGLLAAGAPNVQRLYDAYHRPDWDYFMNQLTPLDPRYGTRIHPGLANAGPGQIAHFIEAAGSFARVDPAFAAALTWAWRENGAKSPENAWIVRKDIEPAPQALTSRVFPGFGVILRAYQGPNETYMMFRAGFDWSHWDVSDPDPGHMVVMSKGAVLLPWQPYAYWSTSNQVAFDMNNTIRFGDEKNQFPFDWADANVLDCAFGATVDYAWASIGIPDWYISPGVNAAMLPKPNANTPNVATGRSRALSADYPQTQGAFEWNRQVVMMKGRSSADPAYFVIRDITTGEGKLASYLYLNLLGRRENVSVQGGRVAVDTDSDTKMDIVFLDPATVSPSFNEERMPLDLHHTPATSGARPVRDWVDKDGKSAGTNRTQVVGEQHVILRVPREPGAGYLWVLYPRGKDEAAPTIRSLAPGVVKVTHAEGDDYVFAAPRPMRYAADGVEFEGCSGAVRIRRDGSVTLALTGGKGHVAWKDCRLTGTAPFERTFAKAEQQSPPPTVASFAFNPDVAGGQPLAPGLTELRSADAIRYVVDSEAPVCFSRDGLVVEACRAEIAVTPAAIRFVVPDPLYAKLAVTNVGVRGVGPFDLMFARDRISGKVGGRTRTLVTTWPADITRPAFHLDGIRYFAGWADDHCIAKGTTTPQFAIAFGVLDGPHEVEIAEWQYPPLPPAPPRLVCGF